MWNEASVRRDSEVLDTNRDRIGFVDAKGVEWKVACHDVPERRGRISLAFASTTGKRRNSEISVEQVDELLRLDEQEWRKLLANAAVIELE